MPGRRALPSPPHRTSSPRPAGTGRSTVPRCARVDAPAPNKTVIAAQIPVSAVTSSNCPSSCAAHGARTVTPMRTAGAPKRCSRTITADHGGRARRRRRRRPMARRRMAQRCRTGQTAGAGESGHRCRPAHLDRSLPRRSGPLGVAGQCARSPRFVAAAQRSMQLRSLALPAGLIEVPPGGRRARGRACPATAHPM